jgi:hypothetical protein
MEQIEQTSTDTTPVAEPIRVNKAPRLPVKEEDLKNLAQRVLEKWRSDSMELRYKSVEDFENDVQDFAKTLVLRGEKGDQRKPISRQLQDLDKEINLHVEDVKVYIKADKGVKQAEPFYAQFGIEKVGKAFKFATDRDARLRSLKKLVVALDAHKLTDKTYGTAYWTTILTQYESLLAEAIQTDSEISGKVREKNSTKDEIKIVLSCIMKLLEAHYPNNYEAVWREWGFQRNRY